MTYQQVQAAVKKGGSIRGAAKLLGKSYTALQWWLAQNGYEVVREARLVRNHRLDSVTVELTAKGQAVVEGEK
jgi:molybdenum-dependent DNA-binding transcriptional regulator ModE